MSENYTTDFYRHLMSELNKVRPEFRNFVYSEAVQTVHWESVLMAYAEHAERNLSDHSCSIIDWDIIAEVRRLVSGINSCLSSMESV